MCLEQIRRESLDDLLGRLPESRFLDTGRSRLYHYIGGMIADWFRPLELSIQLSELARLPRHPAYKYEYFGGRAVLTPRPCYRRATADLTTITAARASAPVPDGLAVRPLQPGDWSHLATLLAAAFRHVPPFAALTDDLRLDAADACLRRTHAGDDGPVVEGASFVAADTRETARLEAAIVITLVSDSGSDRGQRPHITWVLVHPWCFGQGLGTRLLGSAATVLQGLGYRELASTFLVGNERSALWHWRNGFRLVSG